MKKALFQQENIALSYLSPDALQLTYERGKRGLLSCPICHEAVRLNIGINIEPYFFHVQRPDEPCMDDRIEEIQPTESNTLYIERNGFRLPVSRSIGTPTSTTTELEFFKASKPISPLLPAYSKNERPPVSIEDEYLDKLATCGVMLDYQQLQAVTHIEGPLLVLSGAGSGKTRVLTSRTAYMLSKGISPKEIMLVTFTAKAAQEMKDRLQSYPGITPAVLNGLVTGTFHSIFYKILMFHERERWQKESLIKWDWEKEVILKKAGWDKGLDDKEFAYDQAIQQIGLWKNSLLFPSDIKTDSEFEESCLYLYERYEKEKRMSGRYDFDDMLIGCYELFIEQPDILSRYQQRFRYFLVDEFQDINRVQYELIKLLSAENKNVCAVGDDDQAIYSFRGSDPSYILHFENDFPRATIVTLNENYRSSHGIVSTANRIISKNKNRRLKNMLAQYDDSKIPTVCFPYDEELEATMIVADMAEKIEKRGYNPEDFAILYRTNSMSRAIFERLASSNLPFAIERDAESFYERRIVKAMLAFLRLSKNPHDSKAVSDVFPALFLKQNVLQEIKAQSILQDCDYVSAFSFVKTGHSFQERKLRMLPSLVRNLKDMKPSIALEIIEKDLGFSDYVKKRGNEGSMQDKGSDDVRDLKVAAKRFVSVDEFLDHCDHMIAMNKEVKQLSKHFRQAIQLSTIHRSKGLEYKCVYILSAVEGGIPHDFALEAHRQGDPLALEEERRLMYVACTRAKQELVISVPQTRRGKKAHPSRFLKI
ncbi:UvrD-helicase domain-containing protein [Peribacillus alkalitolerans]|uniref:UvrD-helicase domain-containing protein n=1 Tax=Peribacillus alkalitolerans TaxID=1550385 RepID=UPI0013D1417A|nr:ATP-dependent helicase [Peribacillus alkalitolerans]